jgi:hypothetical protein
MGKKGVLTMLKTGKDLNAVGGSDERCDIRVWSGSCDHGPGGDKGERYRCELCESIADIDHEVRHEIFPHVSGDYDLLS